MHGIYTLYVGRIKTYNYAFSFVPAHFGIILQHDAVNEVFEYQTTDFACVNNCVKKTSTTLLQCAWQPIRCIVATKHGPNLTVIEPL